MASKIVIITGANTGIGYETVKALLQSGQPYRIFLGSRSAEKGRAAAKAVEQEVPGSKSTVEVLQIDVASDESIEAARQAVQAKTDHIDALVNNAGHVVEGTAAAAGLTLRQAWNAAYDVNVTGAEVVTHAFVPLLLKSSDPRLLFLGSGTAILSQYATEHYPGPAPTTKGWPKAEYVAPSSYRSSKVATNSQMLHWHWTLKPDGVKTFTISPGFLATGLGGNPEALKARGAGDPALGGQFIQRVLAGERDADAGKFINSQGVVPW